MAVTAPKNSPPSNGRSDRKRKLKEDALALAELLYDIYKSQESGVTINAEQTNANQTGGNKE